MKCELNSNIRESSQQDELKSSLCVIAYDYEKELSSTAWKTQRSLEVAPEHAPVRGTYSNGVHRAF